MFLFFLNSMIKKREPIINSLRQVSLLDHSFYLKESFSFLKWGSTEKSGRNHHGHITVRHRGKGHKRSYRMLHNMYVTSLLNVPLKIKAFIYDSFRSSFILLIQSYSGILFYHLAYTGVSLGNLMMFHGDLPISFQQGDKLFLKYISLGSSIYNIVIPFKQNATYVKSAGVTSILLKRDNNFAHVKLPSKKIILLSIFCQACLGMVANKNYREQIIGKAGRNRWKGIRPTVRGVAMNPVDHPHGGGEGKKSKSVCARSPWGKLSNGQKLKSHNYYVEK